MHAYGIDHAMPFAQFHAAYFFAPYIHTRTVPSNKCIGINDQSSFPSLYRAPDPFSVLATSPTGITSTPGCA